MFKAPLRENAWSLSSDRATWRHLTVVRTSRKASGASWKKDKSFTLNFYPAHVPCEF
jgi:hypothetical protein